MKYTPEKIFQLYSKWRKLYDPNNRKASKALAFTAGDQWDSETKTRRENRGKMCLVFNEIEHIIKMFESEVSSFDYGLNMIENSVKDLKKIKIAQKIWEHIILSDTYKSSFSNGIVKAGIWGYSVAHVRLDYENNFTNQKIPKVNFLNNPEYAFFDTLSDNPHKIDAKFCGLKHKLRASTVRSKYGKKATEENSDTIVDVIHFWYKEPKTFTFYQLKNGKFKREDKISKQEINQITDKQITRDIDTVSYMVVTEDKVLIKPQSFRSEYPNYYTDKLPLVFFGKTNRYYKLHAASDNELVEETTPFAYPLIDTQVSLNIAASEICTSTDNQTKRKFFALPHQVNNREPDFRDINDLQGTVVVGDPRSSETFTPGEPVNPQTVYPQVIEPERFPSELLSVIATYRQMMHELAGINVSQQGAAEDKSVSGAAVNARIAQGSLIHQSLIKHFNDGVNHIGQMLKELFPLVIKGEYRIIEKGEEIAVLNQSDPESDHLMNSIESLNEDYDFTIEALPISRIEKEKALSALMSLSMNKPQLDPYLLDIVVKNLDLQDSKELQRRFEVMVPEETYQYGEGLIDRQKYQEIIVKKQQDMVKQQQQQAQMQVQPMMEDIKMREAANKERNDIQRQKNQIDAYEKEKTFKLNQAETKIKAQAEQLARDKEEKRLELEILKLKSEQQLASLKLDIEKEKLNLDKERLNVEKQRLLLEKLQQAQEDALQENV